MKQNTVYAPLFEAMSRLAAQDPIRLHVPGHKGGLNFPHTAEHVYGPVLNVDWTELTGLDNLHDARGVIAEAQALAAEVFFAEETFVWLAGQWEANLEILGEDVVVFRKR
jgi:arginine decarboxylase